MREVIGPLVDFSYWANRRLLGAVEALPAEAFTREIGRELSFPNLQGILVHIRGAEALWLGRWRGVSAGALERPATYSTVAALRTRWEAIEGDLRGFVGGLTDAELGRAIEYQTTAAQGRQTYRTPLWQMVQHVVNHGTHQRSETATMLTRLGSPPPALNLIVSYRS